MKKYKVTQEFMDALKEWNDSHKFTDETTLINQHTLNEIPENVTEWIFEIRTNVAEGNRRLGAIINWINGEDVFKVRMLKYIVKRTRNQVLGNMDEYISFNSNGSTFIVNNEKDATRFITFKKASEWANKHFEVVEVDE